MSRKLLAILDETVTQWVNEAIRDAQSLLRSQLNVNLQDEEAKIVRKFNLIMLLHVTDK